MGAERERGDRQPLSREEARELLSEAWLSFWMSGQTIPDIETRNRAVRGVLERLSESDREYFFNEKEGRNSELANIREVSKKLAPTKRKNTSSRGMRLHIRRQKAAKHGTNPKRIH